MLSKANRKISYESVDSTKLNTSESHMNPNNTNNTTFEKYGKLECKNREKIYQFLELSIESLKGESIRTNLKEDYMKEKGQ